MLKILPHPTHPPHSLNKLVSTLPDEASIRRYGSISGHMVLESRGRLLKDEKKCAIISKLFLL